MQKDLLLSSNNKNNNNNEIYLCLGCHSHVVIQFSQAYLDGELVFLS